MLHNIVQHRCSCTSINITYLAAKYAICIETLLQWHIYIGRWKGNRADYCFNYVLNRVTRHIKWRQILLSTSPRKKKFGGSQKDNATLSTPNINPTRRMPGEEMMSPPAIETVNSDLNVPPSDSWEVTAQSLWLHAQSIYPFSWERQYLTLNKT